MVASDRNGTWQRQHFFSPWNKALTSKETPASVWSSDADSNYLLYYWSFNYGRLLSIYFGCQVSFFFCTFWNRLRGFRFLTLISVLEHIYFWFVFAAYGRYHQWGVDKWRLLEWVQNFVFTFVMFFPSILFVVAVLLGCVSWVPHVSNVICVWRSSIHWLRRFQHSDLRQIPCRCCFYDYGLVVCWIWTLASGVSRPLVGCFYVCLQRWVKNLKTQIFCMQAAVIVADIQGYLAWWDGLCGLAESITQTQPLCFRPRQARCSLRLPMARFCLLLHVG